MKVKTIKPCGDLFPPLYMCPNCKKGHSVNYLQPKCDVCGIDIEWEQEDGNMGRVESEIKTTRPSGKDIKN